ncbi:UPF0676 protein C1494.01-like isoform X4 [Tachysurus fulvidraco]|uniref:UPF0676 protein C1494.01-like isoform X4 n=1 Tax=Tachysurus fulvidraco TaxID=1234273 RepID=UPI001FED7EA5|nr:UPF0676 protein C1494.01-like isoform X4 [Tachysurus fulvidraco]
MPDFCAAFGCSNGRNLKTRQQGITLDMTMAFVPVVDFEVYKLGTSDVTDENLQELCEEIRKAFTDVGFVFLKNTGIEQKEVDHVMDISKKFFLLPEEEKRPYSRGNYTNNGNHEWVSSERESLNPERPGDLKEAFNTTSLKADINWPSDGFRDIKVDFFMRCKELSLCVLRVMALSLGLDSEFFLKAHKYIGSKLNTHIFVLLHF